MTRLICSVSFLSIAAMIASIVRNASEPMSLVLLSACSASVWTADATASFAVSVFGLNSFWRSDEKSVASIWVVAEATCASVCGLAIFLFLLVAVGSCRLGLRRRRKGLHQRRVGENLVQQFLGSGLAIHVGQEVGQLRARVQQLAQRV